jgi:hypothetical protein
MHVDRLAGILRHARRLDELAGDASQSYNLSCDRLRHESCRSAANGSAPERAHRDGEHSRTERQRLLSAEPRATSSSTSATPPTAEHSMS